jgi:hypothetical protein
MERIIEAPIFLELLSSFSKICGIAIYLLGEVVDLVVEETTVVPFAT